MIHKVKYGLMEIVLDNLPKDKDERAPDLVFKGARGRELAVFFAPFGTIEAEAMLSGYYDYYVPFEAEVLSVEEEISDGK